jgi:hypothetical protein
MKGKSKVRVRVGVNDPEAGFVPGYGILGGFTPGSEVGKVFDEMIDARLFAALMMGDGWDVEFTAVQA